MERGWKPSDVEISPNCPRCGSSNTKFCYYNNYSLTQPRYFCKGCRRYWTKGGSLRNVPVGGGCRKNRRSSSSSKSLISRLPILTDGTNLSSYGAVVPTNSSIGHHASNISSDASHIDLALVYANFLNNHIDQPAENNKSAATFASDHDQFDIPSLEFASLSNTTNNNIMESSSSMQQLIPAEDENGDHLIGCITTENLLSINNIDNEIYYSGLESVHHKHHQDRSVPQCNYAAVLPPYPLPGTTHQQLLWSTTSQFSMNHHAAALQTTHEPVLGPETQVADPNLLFGNWTPFDLSTEHDDTFTRT